jgi:trans-aconitate methyltransferase
MQAIVDAGGGVSTLIDCLLDAGYQRLAVLDVSGVVLTQTRTRLGARAAGVEWFETDVTTFEPPHRFGLWHDRAVFHFLIAPEDRHGYVAALRRTLQPGGTVIVATFAMDGPPQCSDLAVMRYDAQTLVTELGPEFTLQEVRRETHLTPWESEQRFIYFRFQWLPAR